MKKIALLIVAAAAAVSFSSLASSAGEIKKGDYVTVCKSGKECGKYEIAVTDKKECKCGSIKKQMHVLKIEGDFAVLCQCGGKCTCELSKENPYLCGCGMPVKVVKIVK